MNKTAQDQAKLFNDIQADWMALASDAPETEKQRVFKRMRLLPDAYITGRDNQHNIMYKNTPVFAHAVSLEAAQRRASIIGGIYLNISWDCNGKWIVLDKNI